MDHLRLQEHCKQLYAELEVYKSKLVITEEQSSSVEQRVTLYQSQAQQAKDDAVKLEAKVMKGLNTLY